jgi:hypothetical protein
LRGFGRAFFFCEAFLQTRDKAFERLTESFQSAFKARLKQPGAQLPIS